jgi:signal transduction histidine kinase
MRLFRLAKVRRHKPRPFRQQLLLLTVGVLLPAVIFGGFVVWRLSTEQRAADERRLIQSARDLAATLDRELSGSVRSLQALAQSQTLDTGDLEAFRVTADRVLGTQPAWMGIILLDTHGQMLINTRIPKGEPLSVAVEGDSLRQLVESGRPTVGSVVRGKARGRLAFPVRVPVERSGQIKYVLTAIIEPAALDGIVAGSASLADEWTRVIVDGYGTVVARSRDGERFVGQPASPSFKQKTYYATEGVFTDTTLDGVPAYVGFARTRLGDWVTSIVVPQAIIDGRQRQWLASMAATGAVALLFSAVSAILFARRVGASIAGAADAAEQLATGGRPYVKPSSVREVARLRRALRRSAALLSKRERERNEGLARAEAALAEADAARATAERASAAKDQFLAVLSHELRTPLTPVMATVQMLEADPSLSPDVREALTMVRRNVQLEVTLIDDLLDLTRVARGKIELHMTDDIDLHAKLRHVVDICAGDMRSKHQHFVLDLNASAPIVRADGARVQQVLWNLLKNAVKFTPAEGTITVATRDVPAGGDDGATAPRVEVCVTDTGVGIEPAALVKIFNAFEQGGAGVTRQFGGLGLGLTISKALAEMMGGSLSAQSDGAGCGASFTLTLPLASPVTLSTPAVDAPAHGERSVPLATVAAPLRGQERTLGGVRVLLVEDNDDTARAMSRLLGTFGCDVRVVDTVAAATRAAAAQPFDLVLSDLGLPDGTGYDLMQQLRAAHGLTGVAISGFGMEEDIRRSTAAGFADHITKPVDIHRLKQVIERLTSAAQRP